MSIVGEAMAAIRDALRLSDDVKRAGDTLKDMAKELREQDRRITRLEAKWEAVVDFSAASDSRATRRLIGKAD